MDCIDYEFIETDVLDPIAPFFQKYYEDPGGDYEEVCDCRSKYSLLDCALAPFMDLHLSIAEADPKNSTNPPKDSCSLQESKPRADNLIISIYNLLIILILCTLDIILNPSNIQERIHPRVDNQYESLYQTNEKKPIKDILLGIYLYYS